MKKKRFTEEQITFSLRQAESGYSAHKQCGPNDVGRQAPWGEAQSRGYGRLKAAISCNSSSAGTLGGVWHRLVSRLHHVTMLPGHLLRHPVSGTGGGNHNHRIRSRIALNSLRGTAISAIWNVVYRAWVTTLAPILISFSRSVVSDLCFTTLGNASLRRKLARLYARTMEAEAAREKRPAVHRYHRFHRFREG